MQDILAFLEPTTLLSEENNYSELQLGSNIAQLHQYADWDDIDVVLVGCGAYTNNSNETTYINTPDLVRKHLYQLFYWHGDIKIADAGNVLQGATIEDTRAALLMVLREIESAGKIALVLGGSHDLTMAQYDVFRKKEQMSVAAVADMLIDLEETEGISPSGFLMNMLTDTPNYIAHYSHMAFQSYYNQPRMLETLDKLRFDFFRLGILKENIEEMEPVLRGSDFFSFDLSAVRYSDAVSNINGSPNGLTGEDACSLTRYAGMSHKLSSLGIYGYYPEHDQNEMTAKLISQMVWYFIDGILVRKAEASLENTEEFFQFMVSFTDNDTTFLKSKRTNRWWMRMPNNNLIPCSYNDYITARSNDIPERWLREQERLM